MQTRLLMGSSAALMAALGLVATFMPQELLAYLGSAPEAGPVLVTSIAGALYLGFAYLNWMARGQAIGGIYARPITLGNFLHFTVVGATLVRAAADWPGRPDYLVVLLVYVGYSAWFGITLFRAPRQA